MPSLAVPGPDAHSRRLLVCFDFEGSYGMPHQVPYDLAGSTRAIVDTLARYQALAVFFIVGQMVEDHPEVVRALAAAGHEIGLHGYRHDDLGGYTREQLTGLDRDLARVEEMVAGMTGTRPSCFRAPYLLGPHFYRREISALLAAHGYRWVSHREIRYPVELLRPDRFPLSRAWYRGNGTPPRLARSAVARVALNAGLVASETFAGSAAQRLRWVAGPRQPFLRDGLIEVPLYAPLDCDLLGLPAPHQDSPPGLLEYARAVVTDAVTAPGALAMVTFHDWIVGSGNRLTLLSDVLAEARTAGIEISPIMGDPRRAPTSLRDTPRCWRRGDPED